MKTLFPYVARGGGGGDNPNVAYLRSDGNDSTAQVGNPAKPYLTAQAAVVRDGAYYLDIGYGSFGNITWTYTNPGYIPQAYKLYLRGIGFNTGEGSRLGVIYNQGGDLLIYDNGFASVFIEEVETGGGARDGGDIRLVNCYAGLIETSPAQSNPGDPGFKAGDISIEGNSFINGPGVNAGGGASGNVNSDEDPSPNGGDAGDVTIIGPAYVDEDSPIILTGGGPGSNSGSGGVGSPGANGNLSLIAFPRVPVATDAAMTTYAGAVIWSGSAWVTYGNSSTPLG